MELQVSCKSGNVHLCCQVQQHHADLHLRHKTTISFLILLFFTSLIFPSIYTNFAISKDPTPIFILSRFASFLSFIIVTTGKLIVDWGGGDQQLGQRLASVLLIYFFQFQKNKRPTKKARTLRRNNCSLSESKSWACFLKLEGEFKINQDIDSKKEHTHASRP